MGIKDLFTDFRNSSRNYAEYNTEKAFFKDVESLENALSLQIKEDTYTPQLDYSQPDKFIKFGSAELFYEATLNKIVDYYPYDGSKAEKNNFYNKLFDGEKYIFDNLYPRFTGYAVLSADGWGTSAGIIDGYGRPASPEYITFKGGPHTISTSTALKDLTDNPYNNKYQNANIYDESIYTSAGLPSDYDVGTRESNLKTNFDTGVTVEFWLKKDAFDNSKTSKEVIFDLWNSAESGSADYGRLTIELTGTTHPRGQTFIVTAQSGTISASISQVAIGENATESVAINTGSLADWRHYAFVFQNSGSSLINKLYVDGVYNDSNTHANSALGEITSGSMIGRIGALVASPSGSLASETHGKLSASIDEFRFWKEARDAREIAINYFVPVGGGTNTDISNTTLGLYYKFNEGITGDSAVDNSVMDYSGRISNGVWTGYSSNSRNTGSAIVSSSAAVTEYREPVIYDSHPDFTTLQSSLKTTGSAYDANNNAAFLNYAPTWVIDEHDKTTNKNLKIISHIVGTYFDKMYLLSKEVPKFRHATYTTASHSPISFASHLPTSLGMYVPELFVNASVLERFENRDDNTLMETELQDTKNLIYLNLYNNLTNIFKSKGTEKSIQNVLRCFYLDDELLKLKKYNVNATYEIKNNLTQVIVDKKGINFNNPNNLEGIVYQRKDSSNPESSGFLWGSLRENLSALESEKLQGFTLETDVLFPNYFTRYDNINRNFVTSSLFGVHAVTGSDSDSLDGEDTTFLESDLSNFQVFAVRDRNYSKNVYFKLTSSQAPHPIPELTSSDFPTVYDNTRWNFSVRVEPNWDDTKYSSAADVKNYKVIFRGINDVLGTTRNSFEVSGTITTTQGSNFLRSPKRVYVGAQRTNLTGALVNKSDVILINCRAWAKSIDNDSLDTHNYGSENSGIQDLQKYLSPNDTSLTNVDLTNFQTLALDWTFNNVTGSDSSGNFVVSDASSGSALIRDNYSWLGNVVGYQHSGYGYGFESSATSVVDKRRVNSFKAVDPEQVVGNDMVSILSDDDHVLGTKEVVPSYLFSIEKNMYDAISSEMLTFFAGVVDFNDLIGAPVNRYRERYKDMEKLRETFFRKVTDVKDVEKYFDYYKWFDDAITSIIDQLLPASVEGMDKVKNLIESHILERNKYQTPFPTLETKDPSPDGVLYGAVEKAYPYAVGFSSLPRSPRDTNIRKQYWKERAERTHSDISSGDTAIDSHREIYRKIIVSNPYLKRAAPTLFAEGATYSADMYATRKFIKTHLYNVKKIKVLKGGSNFDTNKNIQFAQTATHPAGPISAVSGTFIPLNVLLSFMDDLVDVEINNDPKTGIEKTKRHLKVMSGRDWERGLGYKNLKSSMAFPFSIYETTVKSGHQAELVNHLTGANLQITNLHNDVYGPESEKPMQTTFTEYAVGGHQSRHVKLNTGTDNASTRPEAWRILLGTCNDLIPSGAIGLVGPDYPNATTDLKGDEAYPYKPHKKAVYYRDMTAKRPFNFKNIKITGSTALGNYKNTYEYIHTVGAFNNPRQFVENQPDLPTEAFRYNTTSSTSIRTFMDIKRLELGHFENVPEYSTAYLTGTANKSVIVSRFSNPGGIEVMSRGYQDFKSSEFSVYNSINYRNMTVLRPHQGPSGTISTPAINGNTANIQVYDIHEKDYGLYSHLARHTGRFGRDSLHESTPGASYEELPGYHKVHRNHLKRNKIIYGEERRDVPGQVSLTNTKSLLWEFKGLGAVDDNVMYIGPLEGSEGQLQRMFDARWADEYGGADKAVTYTWSAWIKFPGTTDSPRGHDGYNGIFDFGYNSSLSKPLMRFAIDADDRRAKLWLATTDGSGNNGAKQYLQDTNDLPVIQDNNWHHFALTFSGSHGTLETTGPQIELYVDGTATTITDGGAADHEYFQTSSNFSDFRGLGGDLVNPITFFGHVNQAGSSANLPYEFSGFADEVSLYKKVLSSAEINEIYNGGSPTNLTHSSAPSTDSLLGWWRMGDDDGDSTAQSGSSPTYDSSGARLINVAPPLASGAGSTSPDESYGYLVCDNAKNLAIASSSLNFLTGNIAQTYGYEVITGYSDDMVYDNYYVSHQIPRNTYQYWWITQSLADDNNWVGYTPANYLVSKKSIGQTGNELVEAYSFVTESDFGSYHDTGVIRRYGATKAWVQANSKTEFRAAVPTLNTTVYEPITASSNTLGYPGSANWWTKNNWPGMSRFTKGVGTDGNINLFNTHPEVTEGGDYNVGSVGFNALMIKRNGFYGWPSWKPLRQSDNLILRNQRKNNTFTAPDRLGNDENMITYDLPPVSNRGKPNIINFQAQNGQIYVVKATHENETIYYPTPQMDNIFAPRNSTYSTPSQHIIQVGRSVGYMLNWIISNQQVFPSIRNEFATVVTQKTDYDNKYWRDDRDSRTIIDSIYNDPSDPTYVQGLAPTGAYVGINSFGFWASQSAWPLDAPVDFLTRHSTPNTPTSDWLNDQSGPSNERQRKDFFRFSSGAAGELQNEYTYFLSGNWGGSTYDDSAGAGSRAITLYSSMYRGLGATYARPHMCEIPTSVRSPYGPLTQFAYQDDVYIMQSEFSSAFRASNILNKLGGGAAYWDAPANAGYYKKDENDELQFISAPSKPWFNDYADYNHDVKLLAKGFSIIPEYRISENVAKYINDSEHDNPYQELELDIPHVSGANTKTDGDFYITYSNSEFLKDVLQIKNESLLNATEIRLSVTGAIRFNPYKGFYPVQRTQDLVKQFKSSYRDNFIGNYLSFPLAAGTGSDSPFDGGQGFQPGTGTIGPTMYRLMMAPVCAPGILYNSIKSGIAVDWPLVTAPNKIAYRNFNDIPGRGDSYASSSAWATTFATSISSGSTLYNTGTFFDERLPFETMLEPVKHMGGKHFYELESHPRVRAAETMSASFAGDSTDLVYPAMARNFFGAVPSFFLKNKEFSAIKSDVKTDAFVFNGTEVFMMRVKMNRSTAGQRFYGYERDGAGMRGDAAVARWGLEGARAWQVGTDPTDYSGYLEDSLFPVPQDPVYANKDFDDGMGDGVFKETFTMYSRPSAFGPDLAGRPFSGDGPLKITGSALLSSSATYSSSWDCFSGFNPAYTPPYYNGEAWCDIIFRPSAQREYKIEDIIAESDTVYWRFDAGRPEPLAAHGGSTGKPKCTESTRALIYERYNNKKGGLAPYSGENINDSSMQLSASLNLFGIEKITFTEIDKFGNLENARPGESVGQRWVIRPKFETPMMNFANITGSQITYPNAGCFGGNQVAKGMWHQFGRLPKNGEGVYISVEDVPKNWLRFHYDVIEFSSSYNTGTESVGIAQATALNIHKNVKSLADLVGFNKDEKVRLGELKPKTVLREAIVAIPYIIEHTQETGQAPSDNSAGSKKFISIPKERYDAAKRRAFGSAEGDTFFTAGPSISKQLQKMDRFVLPPQFDFVNNPEGALDPFVMYILEFKYELDRDDLSYIWQNLAPRDYKKISFQYQSVAHELMDTELLNEKILENNQHLRWMVFKVKQKAQDDYWDYVDEQAKGSTRTPDITKNLNLGGKYELRHNWPYDYVSFVEMIKMNVEIKYSKDIPVPHIPPGFASSQNSGQGQQDNQLGLNTPQIPVTQEDPNLYLTPSLADTGINLNIKVPTQGVPDSRPLQAVLEYANAAPSITAGTTTATATATVDSANGGEQGGGQQGGGQQGAPPPPGPPPVGAGGGGITLVGVGPIGDKK